MVSCISQDTDWIQTFTGKQFWPLDPRIDDISIYDIAHALSNLCRYGGHVDRFYSVAQHSIYVSQVVPRDFALHGLLHDASEAYLIDVPRPIKRSVGMEVYRAAERNLQRVIYQHFGLEVDEPDCIKSVDMQLLRTEQRDLMKPAPAEWSDVRVGAIDDLKIEPLPPTAAKGEFLTRFYELTS